MWCLFSAGVGSKSLFAVIQLALRIFWCCDHISVGFESIVTMFQSVLTVVWCGDHVTLVLQITKFPTYEMQHYSVLWN